jgi:hypothetical protein
VARIFLCHAAKTKLKSVKFINAWPRSKDLNRGWMKKTCCRGRYGRMKSLYVDRSYEEDHE